MNVARALFSGVRNVVAWILRLFWRQDTSRIKDKPEKEDDRSPAEGDGPKLVDWSAEKVKFLSMPLSEKRKLYHCGSNYVTLREIPTWKEYFEAGKEFLKNLAKDQFTDSCNIDPELNDKVSLWRGDITTLEVDIIVNAANESLLGGEGVDGAIHRAAGKRLKEECASLNGCPVGDAKITGGYQLPAKYVIHTVGPKKSGDDELTSCYQHSLDIMKQMEQRTIAFPCISTGVYGFPNEKAATIALETIRHFLEANKDRVDRIIFCVFLPNDCIIYERLMQKYFPVDPPDASPTSKAAQSEQSDVSSPKEVPSEEKTEKDTSSEQTKEKPQEEQSQEVKSNVDANKADRDATESQQQSETAEHKVISESTVVPPQTSSMTEKHDEITSQVGDTPEGVSAAAENAPEVNLDQSEQSGASGEEQKPSIDQADDLASGSEPERRQKLDLDTHPEQQEMKVASSEPQVASSEAPVASSEPQVQAEAASTENTVDTIATEPGSPTSKLHGGEEQPANGPKEKDDASFAQTEKNENSVLTGDDDSPDFEQISASEVPTKTNGEPQTSDQPVALDTNENLSPATKVDPNKAPSD